MRRPNHLKEWRRKLGVTQQEIQVEAGVSIATICLVERYGYVPTLGVRLRIAQALGIAEEQIWPDFAEVCDANEG